MELEKAYQIYEKMVQIRLVEEAIVQEYPAQEIRTPVHLYIGEEAIASAVSVNLRADDFIISNHRSHGHCLAKGLDLAGFFKELYGKQGGVSAGWGGSMHLRDMSIGVVGTSAIVAGGIPIGAGVAYKQKLKKESSLTVIYFGDGAVDEGVFWETLNFAALQKLPILFVMENNKYASQTNELLRHGYGDITEVVKGFNLPVVKLDGNNALEVYQAAEKFISAIRSGGGPAFMECKTYRWMGHVGVADDSATGYRSLEESAAWREKCPLAYMENYLRQADTMANQRIPAIKQEYLRQIAEAIRLAKEAPYALD